MTAPQRKAGRPEAHTQYDPVLAKLLQIHQNGATTAELAVYMDQPVDQVRRRLQYMESRGQVARGVDPFDPQKRKALWSLPSLTPAPRSHVPPQRALRQSR